jgi:hypothetical protein
LVGCTFSAAASSSVEAKIRSVLSIWEYSRPEYIQLTRLEGPEVGELQRALLVEREPRRRDAISLLLALNCAHPEADARFRFLGTYRCVEHSEFSPFAVAAAKDFDSILALAFARAEDREHASTLLERYLGFWRGTAPIARLGTSDEEYLLELVGFLKAGGY